MAFSNTLFSYLEVFFPLFYLTQRPSSQTAQLRYRLPKVAILGGNSSISRLLELFMES